MAGIDCLCLFLLRYESLGWEVGEDVLGGVENEDGVLEGVAGLKSLVRGCSVESVDASGLGKRAVAEGGVSEVETGWIGSGAASSGLAMRRPPSEPDRSRSPFMMGELHSHDKGDSRRSVVRCGREGSGIWDLATCCRRCEWARRICGGDGPGCGVLVLVGWLWVVGCGLFLCGDQRRRRRIIVYCFVSRLQLQGDGR